MENIKRPDSKPSTREVVGDKNELGVSTVYRTSDGVVYHPDSLKVVVEGEDLVEHSSDTAGVNEQKDALGQNLPKSAIELLRGVLKRRSDNATLNASRVAATRAYKRPNDEPSSPGGPRFKGRA